MSQHGIHVWSCDEPLASLAAAGWPLMWNRWMDPFPAPTGKPCNLGHSPDWHQLWFVTFLAVFSQDYKAGVIYLYVLQMFSAALILAVLARMPGKLAWLLPELYLFWRNMLFASMNLEILCTLILCCVSFFLKNMTIAEFPCCLGYMPTQTH